VHCPSIRRRCSHHGNADCYSGRDIDRRIALDGAARKQVLWKHGRAVVPNHGRPSSEHRLPITVQALQVGLHRFGVLLH
jgi:hypothetical protein